MLDEIIRALSRLRNRLASNQIAFADDRYARPMDADGRG